MNPANESGAATGFDSASHAKWQEPPALTLNERGMICDCNKAGEKLFGYNLKDLVLQHVSKLLPKLSEFQLLKNGQVNSQLGFLCRCGHHFEAKNRLGDVFLSELNFVRLNYADKQSIKMIVRHSDRTTS